MKKSKTAVSEVKECLSDVFTEHFNPCSNSCHTCSKLNVVMLECPYYDECKLRQKFDKIYEFIVKNE